MWNGGERGMWNGGERGKRRILALWLPRLSTDARERLMPPDLRARPFALLRTERQRRMVVAVNRAAAVLGIAPGHTLSDARALEPTLEVAEATPEADSALLGRIADPTRSPVRRRFPTELIVRGSTRT